MQPSPTEPRGTKKAAMTAIGTGTLLEIVFENKSYPIGNSSLMGLQIRLATSSGNG
jgi:hypothetical protein